MGFENAKIVGELNVHKAFEMRGRISGARYGIKATLIEVTPKDKRETAKTDKQSEVPA